MKARVKATGEIVEVEWRYLTNLSGFNSIRYVDQKAGISYFEGDLDFEIKGKFAENCLNGIKQGFDYNPDYWTRLEHQSVIGIYCANLAKYGCILSFKNVFDEAHALVEKMKEEE